MTPTFFAPFILILYPLVILTFAAIVLRSLVRISNALISISESQEKMALAMLGQRE
jgi:hypothetical protein